MPLFFYYFVWKEEIVPKSDDRFYLMAMSNRAVQYGDMGSLIRIEGVVIGGGGAQAVLLLPGMNDKRTSCQLLELDVEEWSDWLQRSDNPEILVGPVPDGSGATLPKIFHRKLRYEISGAVQQKIWTADHYACVYCGAPMGTALLTVDHFIPLELGGANNTTNYLTSCKADNKAKGSQHPRDFLKKLNKRSFEAIEQYLKNRESL
jgi:hypothetical protein